MNPGDQITLSIGASYWKARILESEKYRGAYILSYRFHHNQMKATGVCFPDYPQLPPGTWFNQELYLLVGWVEYEGRIFPMPFKLSERGTRSLEGVDPRLVMYRRIDLILNLEKEASGGVPVPIEVMPNTDWEHRQWKKLTQNSGG